jgi:hypothetical protein
MIPKKTIETLKTLGKFFETKEAISVLEKFGTKPGFYVANEEEVRPTKPREMYDVIITKSGDNKSIWFSCHDGSSKNYVCFTLSMKTGRILNINVYIKDIAPELNIYPEQIQEKVQDISNFQTQSIEIYMTLKPSKKRKYKTPLTKEPNAGFDEWLASQPVEYPEPSDFEVK